MKRSGFFRIRFFPDDPRISRADPDETVRFFPDPVLSGSSANFPCGSGFFFNFRADPCGSGFLFPCGSGFFCIFRADPDEISRVFRAVRKIFDRYTRATPTEIKGLVRIMENLENSFPSFMAIGFLKITFFIHFQA